MDIVIWFEHQYKIDTANNKGIYTDFSSWRSFRGRNKC